MISPVFLLITSVLNALAILGATALARERPDYLRALATALVATLTSAFLLPYVPANQLFLEVLSWILLVKGFFRLSWKRTLVVALVGYAIKFALEVLGVTNFILLLLGL